MAAVDRIGGAERRSKRPGASALLAAAGILAGLGASSCCVLPLALFGLGVSGAWIGHLTALSPYQPIFASVAVACVVLGLLHLRRRPTECTDGQACGRSLSSRAVKGSLCVAAALVGLAVTFPLAAQLIFRP